MLQLLVWNQTSWWYGLKEYRYEKRNVTHHCSHTLPLNFVCILVLYAGTTNQQCRLNDPVHVFGLAIITNSCVLQSCYFQMPASVPVKLSINVLAAQHKSFSANPGYSLVLMIATLWWWQLVMRASHRWVFLKLWCIAVLLCSCAVNDICSVALEAWTHQG